MSSQIPQWSIEDKEIKREFDFESFQEAIDFVNKVAEIAEEHNHHPDICIFYNKVRLTLSTHKAGGLTEKDFVLASLIDKIVFTQTVRKGMPL